MTLLDKRLPREGARSGLGGVSWSLSGATPSEDGRVTFREDETVPGPSVRNVGWEAGSITFAVAYGISIAARGWIDGLGCLRHGEGQANRVREARRRGKTARSFG